MARATGRTLFFTPLKLVHTPSPQPLPRKGGGAKTQDLMAAECGISPLSREGGGAKTQDRLAAECGISPLPPRGGGVGGEGESSTLSRARALRHNQTSHEQAMWHALCAKRFAGFKFRRQQALGRYFVDFVCFSRRLVIELDGSQHADATDYDERRDAWLHQQGFRVLRVWNNEWVSQREAVMEAIWQALQVEPSL